MDFFLADNLLSKTYIGMAKFNILDLLVTALIGCPRQVKNGPALWLLNSESLFNHQGTHLGSVYLRGTL